MPLWMATIRFLLKRFVAQRLLGLSIVVTLAFTVGVLVAGPIYATAAREAILSSVLHSAAVTERNARLFVYGSPGFPYAKADSDVASALDGLPVKEIVRQGRSDARIEAGPVTFSIPLLFRDGAERHLPLEGDPPSGRGEIALPRTIAKELRVEVGDTVTVVGATNRREDLRVTGLFGSPDREDPFWFGALNPFPGPDSTDPSPALLDRDGFLQLSGRIELTTEFAWDTYLALDGLPFVRTDRVPGQLQAAAGRLRSNPTLADLHLATGLDTLMELVRQRITNLAVPIYLVVFQIGAVALAVLAGVGSLTLTRQSFELAVLRSRGFSRGKLVAAQGVQGVLSAAAAYPLGLLVGMALARLASRSNGPSLPGILFPVRLTGAAAALGVAGAAAGAVILLLLSLPHVTRTILEERRLLSREARPLLARYPVEIFVAPLGIFAFLELRSRGAAPQFQRGSLDPLVLLAPTLLLFAASFLALRLLLFGLRRFDRAIGKARNLPVYLAARRLGRSPGASFAASLLLVLSVGLLVVSASYRSIVIRNHEDGAHQLVGADWSVRVAAPAQPLVALREVPAGATAVIRTEPSFEVGAVPFAPTGLAVDPGTYGAGGWWRSDYSTTSLQEILSRLRSPVPGQVLPGGGTLEIRIEAPANAIGLRLAATVERPSGEVNTLSFGPLRLGSSTYTADPEGANRLLSIAVEETSPGQALPPSIDLTVESVTVGGEPVVLTAWEPLRWRGSSGSVEPGGVTAVTIHPGAGRVIGGIAPPTAPLPAVVSPGVAASVGGVFSATMGGQSFEIRPVAVADAFPSLTGEFVVVSTPTLLAASARIPEPGLALNEVWAMGKDPRPALRAADFILGRTQAAGPIVAILSQLPQSLAVGLHFTSAAGGLGLVVIGVAVGLYFAQRRREFEFASLRAMGTAPAQVTTVLVLEQGLLIGFALVAGAGLGIGMLRLMMPYVGRSLAAAFPAPKLAFDWPALAISTVVVVLATGLGLLLALRDLLRSSVTSVLRGEAE